MTVDVLPNGVFGIPHLQADSHNPDTVPKVLEMLGEEPDVVFIDAGHEYNEVKADFDLWWPHAQKMVGFHDILMPGVREFWEATCLHLPSVQIIGRDITHANKWQHGGNAPDGRVNCGGIGVIFKE